MTQANGNIAPGTHLPAGKVADLMAKVIVLLQAEGVGLPPALLVTAGVVGLLKAHGAIAADGSFARLTPSQWSQVASAVLGLLEEAGADIPAELRRLADALPVILALLPEHRPSP